MNRLGMFMQCVNVQLLLITILTEFIELMQAVHYITRTLQ